MKEEKNLDLEKEVQKSQTRHSQTNKLISKNSVIGCSQNQQPTNNPRNTIDLTKCDQINIIKIKQSELPIFKNLIKNPVDQQQNIDCKNQRLQSDCISNQEDICLNRQLENQNIQPYQQTAQQEIKFDYSYSTIHYQSSLDREQFKQFVRDLSDPDDDNPDNNQHEQNIIEFQNNDNNISTSLKDCMSRSSQYVNEVFNLQFKCLGLSFTMVLMIVFIQVNFEIDQNCSLKELYERKEQEDLGSKCPLSSYVVMNLKHISIIKIFYQVVFQLLANIFQLSRRILVYYIFTLVLLIYIAQKCIQQNLNRYMVINEMMVIMLVFLMIQSYLSRHSINVLAYRFIHVVFCMIMIFLIVELNISIRDKRDFYASMIIQHLTFIIKKVSILYLKYRLKSNLQYDDIVNYYIGAVVLEYLFIFDYLLIQKQPYYAQLVAIFNFIVIQIQNINNISLYYQLYLYLKNRHFQYIQRLVAFKYFIVILLSFVHMAEVVISNVYAFTLIGILLRIVYGIKNHDNEVGQNRLMQAARNNGYFDQKIDEQEINDLISQQSIIAYFVFLVYQALLITIKVAFPQNDSSSNQYQFIYQFQEKPDNYLTLSNVMMFNILITILIAGLVVIKSQKGLKVVKQPTKYQPFIVQLIVTIGLLCAINRGLFETIYMKLRYIV